MNKFKYSRLIWKIQTNSTITKETIVDMGRLHPNEPIIPLLVTALGYYRHLILSRQL